MHKFIRSHNGDTIGADISRSRLTKLALATDGQVWNAFRHIHLFTTGVKLVERNVAA